jgi:ABC-2 type transport system permease protein
LLQKIYRVPERDFQERVERFDAVLGLREYLNTPTRKLSLGQRMRSELAAALIHNPKILFLDEPTIGLDVAVKARIRDFLREANREFGTTILLTTHDLDDIEALSHRVVVIDQKIYDGSLEGLKARMEYRFDYGFFTLVFSLYNASFLSLIAVLAPRFILQAELDCVLTRPLGSLYQVFLETLRPLDLNGVVLGAVLMVYAAFHLDLAWGITEWALLLPLIAGAFLVYSGFFLALASVSFWSLDRSGITPPFMTLSRFGQYPTTIYGPTLQTILSTAVPFAFIAFYPSTLLLGRAEFRLFGLLTPLVGAGVFAFAVLVWRKALARYESAGS